MKEQVITFRVAGDTHVGQVREHNEDNLLVMADLGVTTELGLVQPAVALSSDGALFVVADGMGGGAAGEVASETAIEVVQREMNRVKQLPKSGMEILDFLKRLILSAHDEIVMRASRDIQLMGMGTTMTVGLMLGDKFYVAWSGDSRLYRYNAAGVNSDKAYNLPTLEIVTPEHSVVWGMVERGEITAEAARHHDQSHVITQNLGYSEDPPSPDVRIVQLQKGDRLVVCSDGLNSMVGDFDIAEVLGSEEDTEKAMQQLVGIANTAGGHDNITVIVVDVLDGPTGLSETVVAPIAVGETLKTEFKSVEPELPKVNQLNETPKKVTVVAEALDAEEVEPEKPDSVKEVPKRKALLPLAILAFALCSIAGYIYVDKHYLNTETELQEAVSTTEKDTATGAGDINIEKPVISPSSQPGQPLPPASKNPRDTPKETQPKTSGNSPDNNASVLDDGGSVEGNINDTISTGTSSASSKDSITEAPLTQKKCAGLDVKIIQASQVLNEKNELYLNRINSERLQGSYDRQMTPLIKGFDKIKQEHVAYKQSIDTVQSGKCAELTAELASILEKLDKVIIPL